MILALFLLLVGFAVLIKGADFLVSGASSFAKKFNISNLAIGLTVVAIGTSTPELVVSTYAALEGKNDVSFGNIIGSNNLNLLLILGVSGLIFPLVVQRKTVKYEVPLSLMAALVLYVLVNDRIVWNNAVNILSRRDALILLFFFALFMLYIYRSMQTVSDYDETPIKIYATPIATGMILLGLAMLIGGGTLVVDNAVSIAEHYGLSQRLIGLTIIATGTSLPELATCSVAAYRKNTDLVLGNVIGSNLFNILFILAVAGVIRPIQYNDVMNFDIEVLGASTILLMIFMFTINRHKLDRWEAFLLLACYIAYATILIIRDSIS
ncbi:MAG: calcium/sodium antiporter [Cyclobacteriaceae bacterium]|nr:calcium/sodium antiporter [Cyclobacteriaceae bacterium]MDH4295715.1 calcium/sodium antiporter [Cyclobacteriaceae bacterium]MDH5249041.1 calcium/sodium antiporter [Cyclobacteriaceae bacterium]